MPGATGVADDLNTADIEEVLDAVGFGVLGNVLDIGCGTGRMADLADEYVGVDIAPAMVAYARARGLDARLIADFDDLPRGDYDTALALSVCTHLDRPARQRLLSAVADLGVPRLVVDIIPGEDGGDIGRATADAGDFIADLEACGFSVVGIHERTATSGALHRYHYAVH